ncbi:MAG TPA: glycosyltransferase family 39 protein [Pirellulales bacterium]|jgi:hypothetical protein|nr:glycosyltransferase family 39 protein [Pirellulales bacterium]
MAHPATASAGVVRHRPFRLALVLLLALLLRGGLLAAAWHNAPDLHTLYTGDSATYVTPAQSLLTAGTFSAGPSPDGNLPEIYRTPGYPLLLTAGLRAEHLELVTVALQMALGLASILLLYHLAWKLTASPTAALVASLLMAVEPLSIVYTSYVMPETLFTFLLLASLSLLLHYLRASSLLALVAAAILLAAATFVRPITYYLPALFALLLLVRAAIGRRDTSGCSTVSAGGAKAAGRGRAAGCLAAVAFGVLAFAPCAAWQVRNYRETGYSGFTGIPECNLYFSQAASIVARQSGKPIQQVQAEFGQYDEQLLAQLHGPAQAATIRRLGAEGRRIVMENPVDYAKIHLRSMVILLLDPGGSDLLCLLGRHSIAGSGMRPLNSGIVEMFGRLCREAPQLLYGTLAFGAVLGLLYGAATLGLVQSLRHFNWAWVFLFTMTVYFWLIGGTLGCARLRHPVMPLVCMLGGWGLTSLAAWLRRAGRSAPISTVTRQTNSVRESVAVHQAA